MYWECGQLHPVEFAVLRKLNNRRVYQPRWTKRMVPLPYARLAYQFHCEVAHGMKDSGHEAVRRLGYARRMLEAFGKELESFTLGTRGDLPSRQMLSFCWFCAKLAQPLPTRQMLGKF